MGWFKVGKGWACRECCDAWGSDYAFAKIATIDESQVCTRCVPKALRDAKKAGRPAPPPIPAADAVLGRLPAPMYVMNVDVAPKAPPNAVQPLLRARGPPPPAPPGPPPGPPPPPPPPQPSPAQLPTATPASSASTAQLPTAASASSSLMYQPPPEDKKVETRNQSTGISGEWFDQYAPQSAPQSTQTDANMMFVFKKFEERGTSVQSGSWFEQEVLDANVDELHEVQACWNKYA